MSEFGGQWPKQNKSVHALTLVTVLVFTTLKFDTIREKKKKRKRKKTPTETRVLVVSLTITCSSQ